jgi:hypothetical protein
MCFSFHEFNLVTRYCDHVLHATACLFFVDNGFDNAGLQLDLICLFSTSLPSLLSCAANAYSFLQHKTKKK